MFTTNIWSTFFNPRTITCTSATRLGPIDAGRVDLAICRTSVSQTPYFYDSAFVQGETLVVIANTGHPLANRRRLSLRDLADYRWVRYRPARAC